MKKINAIPKFYPIVDSACWVERIVPLGVKIIQLRIKNKTQIEMISEIQSAKKICDQFDCMLVINDYWELALELGISAIHLGFEDSQVADIPLLEKKGVTLGISTHCEEELQWALSLQPSYVALGPIYETTLKKMRFAPQGVEKISQWRNKIPDSVPLVAIGGIKLELSNEIYLHGANSIAVVSDVTAHPFPEMRVKEWLRE